MSLVQILVKNLFYLAPPPFFPPFTRPPPWGVPLLPDWGGVTAPPRVSSSLLSLLTSAR